MYNDKGQSIQEATPSTPVEIVGWKELPTAGDEILQVDSEVSGILIMVNVLKLRTLFSFCSQIKC